MAHLYYADKIERIFNCIDNVRATCDVDLFVSGNPSLTEITKKRYPQCHIAETRNIGYDIWPFINVLNQVDLSEYDYILKIHTKRDMPDGHRLPHVETEGRIWGDFLLSFIEERNEWEKSLQVIQNNDVGMIADYHICIRGREDPREKLQPIVKSLFASLSPLKYQNLFFPAGTMFMARVECFAPLQGLFTIKDFSEDINNHDDGFSHAVERIFGYIVYANGKEIYTNNKLKISDIYREHFIDKIIKKKITRHHTIYKILGIPVFSATHH